MKKEITPLEKEDRAKRLKTLRKIAGLSRQDLGRDYEVAYGNFQNWENARFRGLSENGAKTILHACKMSGVEANLAWVMYGAEPGPIVTEKFYTKNNPTLAITAIADAKEDADVVKIARELLLFQQNFQQKVLALMVQDDGMEPGYLIGEYVAGNILSDEDIFQVVNQDCIVESEGKLWLRQLRAGSKKGLYDLVCNNPRTKTKPIISDVEITRVAPILWVRRRSVI